MATLPDRAEQQMARLMVAEYPDESARLIESADEGEAASLLDAEPTAAVVAVLARLTPDKAAGVLGALNARTLRRVVASLNPSRTASWLARLDEDDRERCLRSLDESLAEELRALSKYPPNTAGALMDPRATSFRADTTVREAIRRLRRVRDRRIQDVFVVHADAKLIGSVALQDIVLADAETRLDSLVRDVPVCVQAVSSREEVVETFESHRIASLPVVDFEGGLLGVLRQRELMQAAQEEATATTVTMVGASEAERALSSPLFAVRKRLPWLEVNLLTAFLAAAVVGLFEDTIARVTALAVLLPVVAGQSGNTGAQALAVTMRGLALREVRTRQWLRVVTKEALAGLGNGVAVALTTAGAVYLWSGSTGLSFIIGISMVLSMVLAGFAGAAIPMILTALRQDPAQSSSIILTTVTDVVGFFSFLGIATLLANTI